MAVKILLCHDKNKLHFTIYYIENSYFKFKLYSIWLFSLVFDFFFYAAMVIVFQKQTKQIL